MRQPRRRPRVAAEEAPARGAAPRGSTGARRGGRRAGRPARTRWTRRTRGRGRARRPKKQKQKKKKKKKKDPEANFEKPAPSTTPGVERRAVGETAAGRKAPPPRCALRSARFRWRWRWRCWPASGASPPERAGGAGGARRRQRRMGKIPRPSPRPGPRPRRRRRRRAPPRRARRLPPKRAPSSYMLYCAEARASLPEGLKVPEQAKLLGASWKALSARARSSSAQLPPPRRRRPVRPGAGSFVPKKTKVDARRPRPPVLRGGARVVTRGAEGDGTGEAARHGVEFQSVEASERRPERAAAEARERRSRT